MQPKDGQDGQHHSDDRGDEIPPVPFLVIRVVAPFFDGSDNDASRNGWPQSGKQHMGLMVCATTYQGGYA